MFQLENNQKYIDNGNIFSQSLLINSASKESKKLVVFDNPEKVNIFLKIYRKIFHETEVFELYDNISYMKFLSSSSGTFVCDYNFFYQDLPGEYEINKNTLNIKRLSSYNMQDIVGKLVDFGYKYSEYLSVPGTYKKEWDIISIKTYLSNNFYKISFFWDEVEEMLEIDENYKVLWDHQEINIFNSLTLLEKPKTRILNKKFLNSIDCQTYLVELDLVDDYKNILLNLKNKINFKLIEDWDEISLWICEPKIESLDEFKELLESTRKEKIYNIKIYTKNYKTLSNFLEFNSYFWVDLFEVDFKLDSFIIWNTYYICDDLLWEIFVKQRVKRSVSNNLDLLLQIKSGDYVTHINHWVGIFKEIVVKEFMWVKREYLELEYSGDDKLFIPISELHRLSKYIWNDDPKLTRLNTNEWSKTLKKADDEAAKIAEELLEIYARRKMIKWFSFRRFREQEEEFRNAFKYKHTPDQALAISDILSDMTGEDPMDRLLAWDVWFWKTEVSMNAIYRAFLNKKQTCFISPLVVLAYEHFETIRDRMWAFWVRVEVLTRFTSSREEWAILTKLRNWEIDCIIWTHRLLGHDIQFKDLWLIIVDEEHKFWVKDKEKLNEFKSNLDILSLSATPIPRSLNFALNWLKKISIISTPPPSKKTTKTFLKEFAWETIKEAIEKELVRWGQVIFINNKISFLDNIKKNIEQIIWENAKVIITHGQMDWMELEDRIFDFKRWKYNILLSTTVVENGVNFLNANTILINDAQNFWISSLHQLRWRVGRKDVEWHCYLLYDWAKVGEDWKKRLSVVVNNSHLGAWFELALRDLEIRWAGDILWIRQSGKVNEVWVTIFIKLLERKIKELQKEVVEQKIDTKIELDLSFFIDNSFFWSEEDKIYFFRNIENIETIEDLDFTYKAFTENLDYIPEEFNNLFLILKTKISLQKYNIASIKKVMKNYIIEFSQIWYDVNLVREFLNFDKKRSFTLVTPFKISVPVAEYKGDREFLNWFI